MRSLLLRSPSREVLQLRLIPPNTVLDGKVIRVTEGRIRFYDDTYQTRPRWPCGVFLEFGGPTCKLAGRNGNASLQTIRTHSMLTAVLAVRNILGAHYDLWKVNADSEYQENGF